MKDIFLDEIIDLLNDETLCDDMEITEEDFLHPERLGETSDEIVMTILRSIITYICRRRYEEANALLALFSLAFTNVIEFRDNSYNDFLQLIKGFELWKEDKSVKQTLSLLSIICDLNCVLKKHQEPRYWKMDFWRMRSSAETICFNPEQFYSDELFEMNLFESFTGEPAEKIDTSIDERIVDAAKYSLFIDSVLTRDRLNAKKYYEQLNLAAIGGNSNVFIKYLEQEISFGDVEVMYRELVVYLNRSDSKPKLSPSQTKFIANVNDILEDVLLGCILNINTSVEPTELDYKFIELLADIRKEVEHDAILYQKSAVDVMYEKQYRWLSTIHDTKKTPKEEQFVYFLEFESYGQIEITDNRIKMSDIKHKVDEDAHAMFDMLREYHKSNDIILYAIDKYLENIERLRFDDPQYKYAGEIIDLWDTDVVNWDVEDEPEYDDYLYITLYAYLVRWLLTDDEIYYEGFMKAFWGDYNEPILPCDYISLDPEFYWKNDYMPLKRTSIDEQLKELIICICQYWETYKPFVRYYLNDADVDKNVIVFEDNEKIQNDDNIRELNFLIDQIDDEKETYKKTGIRLTREEYLKKTRKMPKQCAKMTGKMAFHNIKKSIDPINMLIMMMDKKALTNSEYELAQSYLSETFENMALTIYGSCNKYRHKSFVSREKDKASAINKSYSHRLYASVLIAIKEERVEDLLQAKKEIAPFLNQTDSETKEIIEYAINEISKKIIEVVKKEKLIIEIRERLASFFAESFSELCLPNYIFDTLVTAEYLYDEYIERKKPIEGWDYSFISVLYYQVLEGVLNHYIYKPYIKEYAESITKDNKEDFFGRAKCCNIGRNNSFSLKEVIELGPMGYLLKESDKITFLKDFIIREHTGVNVQDLVMYGTKLLEASERRNHAAHAKQLLYEEARDDRNIVYSMEIISYSEELRNMVNAIFVILYGTNR